MKSFARSITAVVVIITFVTSFMLTEYALNWVFDVQRNVACFIIAFVAAIFTAVILGQDTYHHVSGEPRHTAVDPNKPCTCYSCSQL